MGFGEPGSGDDPSQTAAVDVAGMLLGSFAFFLSLFYIVSFRDRDIQRYAWQAISATISIFCAVLIFQTINGAINGLLAYPESNAAILIGAAQMVLWFIVLQVALGLLILGRRNRVHATVAERTKAAERMELNIRCFGLLLAHTSAFAAKEFFSEQIQQRAFFAKNIYTSILVVPIALATLWLLFWLTNFVRERISKADDGAMDQFELRWDEETEEAENDVVGIAVSFLICQSLRFSVDGHFPDGAGEPKSQAHTARQLVLLVLAALVAIVISAILVHVRHYLNPKQEKLERARKIGRTVASILFAWLLFYTCGGVTSTCSFISEAMEPVVLALLVSLISFILIIALDKAYDLDATGEDADRAIIASIESIGILIGVGWESAFDKSVDVIADSVKEEQQELVKFLLAVLLCLLVFPAWRIYIMKIVIEQEQEEEQAEEIQQETGQSVVPQSRSRSRSRSRGRSLSTSDSVDTPLGSQADSVGGGEGLRYAAEATNGLCYITTTSAAGIVEPLLSQVSGTESWLQRFTSCVTPAR